MAARARTTTTEDVSLEAHWHPATRAAFRFCFVYFALYAFATQIAGGLVLFPGFSFPNLGTRWPMREITLWLATHLFHIIEPLIYSGNSGDTAFHWIQIGWLLVVAMAGSAIWTLIDRHRSNYAALQKWSRLFVRFALAARCFTSACKVIPTRSFRSVARHAGERSATFRTDMQWTAIGSSVGYQMFTGWARGRRQSC